jgi:hypothetical protein
MHIEFFYRESGSIFIAPNFPDTAVRTDIARTISARDKARDSLIELEGVRVRNVRETEQLKLDGLLPQGSFPDV